MLLLLLPLIISLFSLIPSTLASGPTSIFIDQVPDYAALSDCAESELRTIVRGMAFGCGDGDQTTSFACFCYASSAKFSSMIDKHVRTACEQDDPTQTFSALAVFHSYCQLGEAVMAQTESSIGAETTVAGASAPSPKASLSSASPTPSPSTTLVNPTGSGNNQQSATATESYQQSATNTSSSATTSKNKANVAVVAIAVGVTVPSSILIAVVGFLLYQRHNPPAPPPPGRIRRDPYFFMSDLRRSTSGPSSRQVRGNAAAGRAGRSPPSRAPSNLSGGSAPGGGRTPINLSRSAGQIGRTPSNLSQVVTA